MAQNVTYKSASVANNTSDLDDVDLLILSSTAGSGDYRGKFHNSAVSILNWEEAVMDSGDGEFGLSSQRMVRSSTMTQMTITEDHPITAELSGTINFVSSGADTFATDSLSPEVTSVASAANGEVAGNSTVFFVEAGQAVDPVSGANPAKGRRVMLPMADDTFRSLTPDGLRLFENAVTWAADVTVETGPLEVINRPAIGIESDTATIGGQVTSTGDDPPTVTLYWGDNDGGASIEGWDNSVDVGVRTGIFNVELTALNPRTTYFYRARAVNTDESAWAATTESFTTDSISLRDIEMYNDHVPGDSTHVNATGYSANLTASGRLTDFETGETSSITLTVTQSGVRFAGSSAFPEEGTDAERIFGGKVDFSTDTGTSLEIENDDHHTHTYSNLDPNSEYEFVGTSIRGNASYTNRWTLVTLSGVVSATPAHSSGNGIVTEGLDANQVALWVGDNSKADQGFVVQWTGIDPGEDGEFEVVQRQYTGAVPTSIHASGIADGSKGYGLSATRLIERFAALAVVNSDPVANAAFTAAPSMATLDFSLPIDPATVSADDLRLNGVAATGFTIVDTDTVRFSLPNIGFGNHAITVESGAIATTENLELVAVEIPFSVVTSARVDPVASDVLATSAQIGADVVDTGFDDPMLAVFYGTIDGGTNPANWQASATIGQVGSGVHTATVADLQPDTTYFYRAQATNLAGTVWSAGGTFTTQSATLPQLSDGAASNVGAFTADVSGAISDLGNDAPLVTLYYGDNDGGTNVASWDDSLPLGLQDGAFTASLTGLAAKTQHFFRFRAENAAGASWATSSGTFITEDIPLLLINEVQASNSKTFTTRTRLSAAASYGTATISPDWIEIYNPGTAAVDLGGFHLTDDVDQPTKWAVPDGTTIGGLDYLVLFASGENITDTQLDQQGLLHANFAIDADGEYVALTGAEGETVHELILPNQQTDISYGLDQQGEAVYFLTPTPNARNSTDTAAGMVADIQFSFTRGFYDEPFTTVAASQTPGATIVYTTDGSEPTLTNGTRVTSSGQDTPSASVEVDTTTVVRAFAFKSGLLPARVDTHTYLFLDDVLQQSNRPAGFPTSWGGVPAADYEMDPEIVNNGLYSQDVIDGLREIPTLSISSSVANVFGSGGIYSNTRNSNLEVPASAEWIWPDGSSGFQIDAGFKVQGGASRNPDSAVKHSLSLRFREQYGAGELDFDLFPGSPVDEFDTLQLRAMYNNSWIHWSPEQRQAGMMIRDQFFRDVALGHGTRRRRARNLRAPVYRRPVLGCLQRSRASGGVTLRGLQRW